MFSEFDITYSEINDTETLVAASMNIDDSPLDTFSLTFFVKCEQCDNIVCIARTDGQTVVSVTNTDQLQIEFDGYANTFNLIYHCHYGCRSLAKLTRIITLSCYQ